ncbi:hypothetical protein K457DRAFT_139454 [Linnemannia elongata AG-77]|uniref:Uncharacterized protein n=1 Tax=Linnemannia elongata AG-77 TaxID=1314771 RepID=A0A197JRD6_9FUNG|nr:hypothetical protein K457DRAFT_139454 [Linnemannia elongata AG-77]
MLLLFCIGCRGVALLSMFFVIFNPPLDGWFIVVCAWDSRMKRQEMKAPRLDRI